MGMKKRVQLEQIIPIWEAINPLPAIICIKGELLKLVADLDETYYKLVDLYKHKLSDGNIMTLIFLDLYENAISAKKFIDIDGNINIKQGRFSVEGSPLEFPLTTSMIKLPDILGYVDNSLLEEVTTNISKLENKMDILLKNRATLLENNLASSTIANHICNSIFRNYKQKAINLVLSKDNNGNYETIIKNMYTNDKYTDIIIAGIYTDGNVCLVSKDNTLYKINKTNGKLVEKRDINLISSIKKSIASKYNGYNEYGCMLIKNTGEIICTSPDKLLNRLYNENLLIGMGSRSELCL